MELLPGIEKAWIERYGKVALTGEPAFFEEYAGGLGKYFTVTAFRSAPNQFSCIFIDITERKLRENEITRAKTLLQASIESLKDMIIMAIDRYYRYLCFNSAHSKAMKTAYGNELREALETNKRLLGELQHRAKNSFNMISGMAAMASNSAVSSETKKALGYLGARINAISELYSFLFSTGSFNGLQLDNYCVRVATPLIALTENISLRTDLDNVRVSVKNAAPIGIILTELITNTVKYTFPGGRRGTVILRLKKIADGQAILEIMDDGVGLPSGFDIARHAGMGLNLVQELAEQIGGVFKLDKGFPGTRCALEFGIEPE